MTVDRTISFRSQLYGQLADFLKDEGFACADTTAALANLVARLATYAEEGVYLFPEVYLCDNIATTASSLPSAEVLHVGKGQRTEETAIKALKECAPLARGGWKVFVERQSDAFAYGLFRGMEIPIAITPEEVLIEAGGVKAPIVLAAKVAVNCVEVRGACGNRRVFHFSNVPEESPFPRIAIERLAAAIVCEVETGLQDSTYRFVRTVLLQSFQGEHGALAIVLGKKHASFPGTMRDAIKLAEPIMLAGKVADYEGHRDQAAFSRLQGVAHLVIGMLHCDGIVIFRCDGTVLGYRGFLAPARTGGAREEVSGGARRRTYEALKNLIGAKVIGVFSLENVPPTVEGWVAAAGSC